MKSLIGLFLGAALLCLGCSSNNTPKPDLGKDAAVVDAAKVADKGVKEAAPPDAALVKDTTPAADAAKDLAKE